MIDLLLLLTCVFDAGVSLQDAPAGDAVASDDPALVPFTLTEANNLAVEVVLNGEDRVTLMFHTSTDAVFLTRAGAEKSPSVRFDSNANVRSWGGESAVRYSAGNSLRIGEMEWTDVGVTEAELSGTGTDGKFGPDLFAGRIVEVDFDERALRIHDALPSHAADFERVAIEEVSGGLSVRASVRLGSEWVEHGFLLHTGFGGALLFDAEFARAQRLNERLAVTDGRELRDSLGNVIRTQEAVVPAFRIGGLEVSGVRGELFPDEINGAPTSVAGCGIWTQFDLMIDLEGGFLYLRSREDAPELSPRERDQRGDELLFDGRFDEAIADYDAFLAAEPRFEPHHWRRGIAYYYAGRFEDGASQFVLHRTVNPDDVENAAWHFLCVARAEGVEKARAQLLPVGPDQRDPMMTVYELFAGRASEQDVLDDAARSRQRDARFFAHLYLGLYHDVLGNAAAAREQIELAVTTHGRSHYMGRVARVHAAVLAR